MLSMNNKISDGSIVSATTYSVLGITLAKALLYIPSLISIAYLNPEEIGQYALAVFLMMTFFALFTTGTDSRIIAMKDKDSYLSESWSIEILRGSLVLISMLSIYLYAYITNSLVDAHSYILVLGVAMLIKCSKNINLVVARKKLNMAPIFYTELGSAITITLISVCLLIYLKSAWALVYGYLAGSIIYTCLSFILLPKDPCFFKFNNKNYFKIFNYSKWIMLSSQSVSFFENVVPLIISKLFGVATLGIFEKSDQYSRKIIAQLNQIFWMVGLPWASRENYKNKNSFELISILMLFYVVLVTPALVILFLLIPKLIIFIGGDTWLGVEDIVFFLCIVSAISSINSPFGIVLQAIKLPNLSFYANFFKLFAFVTQLLIFEQNNLIDFIYAIIWAELLVVAFYLILCFFKIHNNIFNIMRDIILYGTSIFCFYYIGYNFISSYDLIMQIFCVFLLFIINLFLCFILSSVRHHIFNAISIFLNNK